MNVLGDPHDELTQDMVAGVEETRAGPIEVVAHEAARMGRHLVVTDTRFVICAAHELLVRHEKSYCDQTFASESSLSRLDTSLGNSGTYWGWRDVDECFRITVSCQMIGIW